MILSIYGGSGSGKSTLAKALVGRLSEENAARIPADYFLKSNAFASLEMFLTIRFNMTGKDWKNYFKKKLERR